MTANPWRDRAALICVMLVAAIGWYFSKQGIGYFQPFEFMGLRFGLAAVLLLFFMRNRDWSKSNFIAGLKLGGVFFTSMVFWISAVDSSDLAGLGLGGFIMTLGVILSPLVGRIFFKEPLHQHYGVSMLAALVGAFLMLGSYQSQSLYLFVVASTFLALYISMMTGISRRNDHFVITFVGFVLVSVCMTLLSFALEARSSTISLHGLGWLLLSGVIATALRFILQIRVQGRMSQSEASIIMNLESVFVAGLAITLFGAQYQWLQWTGAALIVTSAILIVFRPQKKSTSH